MKFRYTPAAICDLEEIEAYIRDTLQNPDAAVNIITSIAADCAQIKDQSHLGPELHQKLHREVEGHYLISGKYIVIYEIDEAISIQRVLDTRTDYMQILFGTI